MNTMLAAACLVAFSTLWATPVPAAESLTEKAADIKETTKDRAVRMKESLTDKASNVTDTMKEKATEAKDKAVEAKNKIKDKITGKTHRREPGRASASPTAMREAQQALNNRGYDPGPIDGKMGPKTHAALADFQRTQGLDVNGTLDSATATRLKEPGSNRSSGATPHRQAETP